MQDSIIEALRSNAVDQALEQAREWVEREPQEPQALRWLAAALQQSGDHAAAMDCVERAIGLAPEDAVLQLMRARLLISGRQVEAAGTALAAASKLDPNQFGAYLVQAQLALGRGDLDEAERCNRLAARVVPDHPHLAVVEGMVALQRGDGEWALKRVSAELQRHPDDLQLRYALGFIYMGNQHWAFAEQVFRTLAAATPGGSALHGLLADLLARQGRPGEAADQLEPLLANADSATPSLQRLAGSLRLAAGAPEAALPPLLAALRSTPGDPRLLACLLQAWHQLGRPDEARATLESALASAPDALALWQARMGIERQPEAIQAVLQRWRKAMPEATLPLQVELAMQQQAGDPVAANEIARQLLERDPRHPGARLQVLDGLARQDPALAVARLEAWLQDSHEPAERRFLLGLLGLSHDQAGRAEAAVDAWSLMQLVITPTGGSLPPTSAPRGDWPDAGPRPDPAAMVVFLWGAPGSGVDRVAAVLQAVGPFRADRFSAQPPQDGLQSTALVAGLSDGSLDGAGVVARWRAGLPARGLRTGDVIDWLPWWDNALLVALRPQLPAATLMVVLRDPRDMLLEWLAFGDGRPFALPSPMAGARYLAAVLDQVAALHESRWLATHVVHADAIGADPVAAAHAVNHALQGDFPVPPSVGPPRFPAGHWRLYAEALAEPFALLSPVAARLGYPADPPKET